MTEDEIQTDSAAPTAGSSQDLPPYEKPVLIPLGQVAVGGGVGWCQPGSGAADDCRDGNVPTDQCKAGNGVV